MIESIDRLEVLLHRPSILCGAYSCTVLPPHPSGGHQSGRSSFAPTLPSSRPCYGILTSPSSTRSDPWPCFALPDRRMRESYVSDKNKTDSAAQSFRLVSEAYRVLTSPDSKQQYDRTRRYTIETPPSNGGRGGGGASSAGSSRKGRGKGYSDNVRGYGNGGGYW